MVVNADGPETRVALVEDGQLREIYIERKRERGIVGNIYKGRVQRVLPGMQAAFVDIGVGKSAFLYVAEVRSDHDDYRPPFLEDDDDEGEEARKEARPSRSARIEDLLKEGQEVVIQITKDPIGTKGARSTTYISIPGRNLVYMPTVNHLGISRRIGSEKERKRLREVLDLLRPEGGGLIVRTVAADATEKDLRQDLDFLVRRWTDTLKKAERAKAPALLYVDLDLLLRMVRDLMTEKLDRMIIDSEPDYQRVIKFVREVMPSFEHKIEHYTGSDPIFDDYGIELEIDRSLERKVWLKSGGYLIIDQAEAATIVDVNTGKFGGSKDLEETITKTNVEAAGEVAEQLRLRNIGGIIIVDFIDMEKESSRRKLTQAFEEFLAADKSRTSVTGISSLGLVEMSRKRTRESLGRILTEPCGYCGGKGYLKSAATVASEILRKLKREGDAIPQDTIVVSAHPEVAGLLGSEDRFWVEALEKRLHKKIQVKGKSSLHLEKFEIAGLESQRGGQSKDGSAKDGGGREEAEAEPMVKA
jgi:ribonuclease G